jgi:hypothetical protein
MKPALYSACIGDSVRVAESIPYETLIRQLIEFTARAAVARSIDESDWEHEELRRKGLSGIQLFQNGKAVWTDRKNFEEALAEAQREQIEARFKKANKLNAALYDRLDKDLRARWCKAGYKVGSLFDDMKGLFTELERDARDRAAGAREDLVGDVLGAVFSPI